MAGHEKAFQEAFIAGLQQKGWVYSGSEGCPDYDKGSAIIPSDLKKWIVTTQPDKWKQLIAKTGNEDYAIKSLIKELVEFRNKPSAAGGGTYNLLLNGIVSNGIKFIFFQPKPVESGNVVAEFRYEGMIFRVVSELYYSQNSAKSIDLAFFINGIPVGTAELKNPTSGQGVSDSESQYRKDRVPGQDMILHASAGALFHFAVATNKASLTTALCGEATRFIPFNTGIDNTAYKNSQQNPKDYSTSYLWKEVMTKETLSLIVFGMMRNIDGEIPQTRFPRYHQLDNLKKITEAVKGEGGRRNYLSQHAPGSGKSDEIANLAYALSSLHDENGDRIYSSVIIITNRTVLDDQIKVLLKDKAKDFFQHIEKNKNGVSKSSALSQKLLSQSCPRIMSVTAQTFTGTLLETMRKYAETGQKISGNYAVIVDEAHDGETGKQHENMYKALLGVSFDHSDTPGADGRNEAVEDSPEAPDEVLEADTTKTERAVLPVLNFFAYTATPDEDTLRVFGHKIIDAAGKPSYVPFHTYSMHQAREEGYINDVLANYVTHERYVKIDINNVAYEGDRIVDFVAGRREIKNWMRTQPQGKNPIVEIIMNKMRNIVLPLLNGKGKAMLCCSSREEALAYKHMIDKALAGLKEDEHRFDTLVAYSGTLADPVIGADVTETDYRLNKGLRGRDIATAFDEDDNCRLLIVADKYQVGFDQPKLVCMFLDKPLKGINLIQTTARVNRKIPGKENVYIFDFINDQEQVIESFRKFDVDATLAISNDLSPATLEELLEKSAAFGIHKDEDIANFSKACAVWENPSSTQAEKNEASMEMSDVVDSCSVRFQALTDQDSRVGNEYKALLRKYNSVYSLLSITRSDWEAILAIYSNYGKEARFFSSLVKALAASREADVVSSVDVNALCLTKYDVIPQGPIGSLTAGASEGDTANYSGDICTPEVSTKLGPVEVLINEINDYPEISENSQKDVKDLMEVVILSMESDPDLLGWAVSNPESTFARHTRVHDKILRLLSRQSRNKTEPGKATAAKVIVAKQKNDSSVLVTIAQTLYQVLTNSVESTL
jgi:type I restriction enzyme R subunit